MPDTDEVLRDMDRAFEERMREERDAHRRSREFVRGVCDSGQVDGVTPTGPPPVDDLDLCCGVCGATIAAPEVTCRVCR